MIGRRLLMGGGGAFTGPLDEQGRWSARSVVIEADVAWEGLGVLEPCVIHETGYIKGWYRGGGLHGPTSALGYFELPDTDDLTDAANYSKYPGNPVFGNGVGGEAGQVYQPHVFQPGGPGTTRYIYYHTGSSALKVATVAGAATFVVLSASATLPGSCTLWGNFSVWKEGSDYFMLAEAYNTSVSLYLPYLYTSTDGLAWTIANGGIHLSSLQPAAGCGSSIPHFLPGDPKLGGALYQGWYHASSVVGITSDIFRAYSSDKINWTIVVPKPILTHSGTGFEVDQLADPQLQEVGGDSYMWMDADDGTTDICAIEVVTFGGTLAQLAAGT